MLPSAEMCYVRAFTWRIPYRFTCLILSVSIELAATETANTYSGHAPEKIGVLSTSKHCRGFVSYFWFLHRLFLITKSCGAHSNFVLCCKAIYEFYFNWVCRYAPRMKNWKLCKRDIYARVFCARNECRNCMIEFLWITWHCEVWTSLKIWWNNEWLLSRR